MDKHFPEPWEAMDNHFPGPWEVSKTIPGAIVASSAPTHNILGLYRTGTNEYAIVSGHTDEEADANAELMALSPTLLDENRLLLAALKRVIGEWNGQLGVVWQDAVEVIRKVEERTSKRG